METVWKLLILGRLSVSIDPKSIKTIYKRPVRSVVDEWTFLSFLRIFAGKGTSSQSRPIKIHAAASHYSLFPRMPRILPQCPFCRGHHSVHSAMAFSEWGVLTPIKLYWKMQNLVTLPFIPPFFWKWISKNYFWFLLHYYLPEDICLKTNTYIFFLQINNKWQHQRQLNWSHYYLP